MALPTFELILEDDHDRESDGTQIIASCKYKQRLSNAETSDRIIMNVSFTDSLAASLRMSVLTLIKRDEQFRPFSTVVSQRIPRSPAEEDDFEAID